MARPWCQFDLGLDVTFFGNFLWWLYSLWKYPYLDRELIIYHSLPFFFFTCIFICFLSLFFIVVSSVSGISTIYCEWINESKSLWWSCLPRIVEVSSFNCHWTRSLRKQAGEAPVFHPHLFPTSLCSSSSMSLCYLEPLDTTNTICPFLPVYLMPKKPEISVWLPQFPVEWNYSVFWWEHYSLWH